MGKTATNISIVLGLITVAFAGYYMYVQQSATTLNFESTEQTKENMLINTSVFIDYHQSMNQIKLDLNLFEDKRFTSLRSFATPIQERPIGRPDPFADLDNKSTNSIQ